jgi:hypothetical protein
VPADRIAVAELAELVGLEQTEIVRHFQVLCFRPGYDFEQLPTGMILRRAVLPELVGEFAVSGNKGAAARLMQWLTAAGDAVPAAKVYSKPLFSAPEVVTTPKPWYSQGVMA